MLWLAKCEVDTSDYQDAGEIRWPVYTTERKLRIERVEYDKDEHLGVLYYRTRRIIEPDYDLKTGKCAWRGYRHEVILIRQTQRLGIEIPDDCGALAGSFPDRYRGRWLVFSPAPRRHDAERPAPRPPTAQRNGHAAPSLAPPAPAIPIAASSPKASAGASDSDWLEG